MSSGLEGRFISKGSDNVKIALIGGSGLEKLLESGEVRRVGTPYGPSPPILIGRVQGRQVAFLPRHGTRHEIPPHKVNYRANLWSLKQLGVERIIATNAVGAINLSYKPGELAVPADLVDFTRMRAQTFYDEAPVTHIDVTEPYCPELRAILLEASKLVGRNVWSGAILAATEGPRYETPAEIRMLRTLGCDIVGMTGAPEVFLAKELEMCYATVCFISNMAAGIQDRLTATEVMSIANSLAGDLMKIIQLALKEIPEKRSCRCGRSLEEARV